MIKVWAPSQLALQVVDQEFNAYALSMPSPEGTHPLAFLELAQVSFPTIYAIVLDYLPIQASTMLKFWLKKDRLNFTKDWITPQKDMAFDEDDDDLLAQLFSTMNVSTLDDILSAIARVEGDNVSSATVIF
ncbi:hypothetical protein EV363DRAFT_1299924 [Boletus edulis]|nr:hypothetical protein EV363DRAFT_1299924 [Boletus edulis]